MEQVLYTTAACILSAVAGYAIAHDAQAARFKSARDTLAQLRKDTACACGFPAHHSGKHAPHAFYSKSPAGVEFGLSFNGEKITRSRIPTQPKKESKKPRAIHRTMSRQKKS